MLAFETECEAIAEFPWTEDFESVTDLNFPQCWFSINNNYDSYIKKYNIGDDILKRINDNKYSSYYGDSSNNVYYEIKHLNDSNKKVGNINSKIANKRGLRSNLGNYNSYGVQSEALYIPKDN